MSQAKISVIVPVYNVDKFLDRCLISITRQTLKDLEIILVDDGSPDNSPQMCEEWAKKDNRIRVIHKENGGLGFARNSGMEIATGEFIAFVDSDDYIEFDMYEKLYQEAEESDSDIVYSGFNYIASNGQKTVFTENEKTVYWEGPQQVRGFALDMMASGPYEKATRKYEMSVWRAIYKRDILVRNNIIFHSERDVLSEDIVFDEELFHHVNKIAHIPFAFYNYCQNNGSLTKTFDTKKFYLQVKLHSILAEMFKDDSEALLHVDRMFIECSRGYMMSVATSDLNDKRRILGQYMAQPVFDVLRKRYKPGYLPYYPRLFYLLEINKSTNLMIFVSKLIKLIKATKFYHPYMTKKNIK